MFLTDKYHALLPFHSADSKNHRRPGKATSRAGPTTAAASCFDAALAARLRGLLPQPASPLAALASLADLLAATLGDAVPALAGEWDASGAVAAHLDAGVALLDACNAIAARIDRLRRRRLLSRFAIYLLSSSPSSPLPPSSIRRARAALADRDDRAAASPTAPLPCLPFDQPRDHHLVGAARVLLAVNAVSSLAGAAAAAVLRGGGDPLPEVAFPLVSGDFSWVEPFNAVSSQLSGLATATREVDAVDEAVGKLAAVLDADVVDEAALRAPTQEVEKWTEELTARLDRLSNAVNGVFRAALCLRNAELGSFMVGPAAGKTRK